MDMFLESSGHVAKNTAGKVEINVERLTEEGVKRMWLSPLDVISHHSDSSAQVCA